MLTHSLQAYADSLSASPDGLRSSPRQDRSRQSLQHILSSTAAIIDVEGYAGVTTAEVAKRTGLAIGTVYRFFPDRIALMFGVYDDVLRRFLDLAVKNLDAATPSDWRDALRVVLESSAQARREVSGFRSVHHRILGETGDDARYQERLTGIGAAIAGELAPFGLPQSDAWVGHVTVAYDLSLSLQRLAFETDAGGDPRLLEEAVVLPTRYLEGHLDEES